MWDLCGTRDWISKNDIRCRCSINRRYQQPKYLTWPGCHLSYEPSNITKIKKMAEVNNRLICYVWACFLRIPEHDLNQWKETLHMSRNISCHWLRSCSCHRRNTGSCLLFMLFFNSTFSSMTLIKALSLPQIWCDQSALGLGHEYVIASMKYEMYISPMPYINDSWEHYYIQMPPLKILQCVSN